MAGKRLYDITKSSIYEEGFNATDSFVITNKSDDKIISVYDFIKALRDGGYSGLGDGLEEEISFVTPDTIEAIKTPDNGKYKIEDGQIYQLNEDNGNWYSIAVAKSNGDTIKWTSKDNNYNTVSVDDSGVIKYPNNFIKANKIMTIDGDQTGFVVVDDNGVITSPSNFVEANGFVVVDDNGVITSPSNFVEANISNYKFPYIVLSASDESGNDHQVKLKCRIRNGVPQFYGEIIQ